METLDRLAEVRRERDVLVTALEETQRQLGIARAMVEVYRDKRGGDDADE